TLSSPHVSVPPKLVEPLRCQLGVPDRVLDILVAEVMLDGPCILAVIDKLEACRVTKHMRMNCAAQPGQLASTLNHLPNRSPTDGAIAFGSEHVGRRLLFALKAAQRSQLGST